MKEYHKIQSLYKRDEKGQMLFGSYSLEEFEYLKNNKWEWTEKVDGTNIRIIWNGKDFVIAGKTDRATMPPFLISSIEELINIEKMSTVFDFPVCLYGEGYGERIQKGGGNYISDGTSFVLFDVLVGDLWLKREDIIDIAIKLGISSVPMVGVGTLSEMEEYVKSAPESRWGAFKAEGVVARPVVELKDRRGHRIITKLKLKDFGGVA